mgnify:CR=1 FL=1
MRSVAARPWWSRPLEIAGITAFLTFAVLVAERLLSVLVGPPDWAVAALAVPVGYLAADFISGFVHWMADRFGSPDTFFVGPKFVQPFRDHHVRPTEITEHDVVETNGDNCLISFWVLGVVWCWWPAEPGEAIGIFGLSLALSSMLAIMATNQIHKWAHMAEPPRGVRLLQRFGLILSPEMHSIHHTSPFDTYYCITTGWLNWILARLRFFEALERLALRLFGLVAGAADAPAIEADVAPGPERV